MGQINAEGCGGQHYEKYRVDICAGPKAGQRCQGKIYGRYQTGAACTPPEAKKSRGCNLGGRRAQVGGYVRQVVLHEPTQGKQAVDDPGS